MKKGGSPAFSEFNDSTRPVLLRSIGIFLESCLSMLEKVCRILGRGTTRLKPESISIYAS